VSQERPSGGPRFGIIQSVTPQERVARVRFFDEGTLLPQVEEISLYDLNSHPLFQYGLGDHVLIRSRLLPPTGIVEEVVNLAAGFVEGLVRTVTDFDDDLPNHQRAASGFSTDIVDWMGEIYKINIDGTVKVRLAREYDPPPEWTGERFTVVKGEDLIVFEGSDDEEDDEMGSVIEMGDWIDNGEGEEEGWVDSDSDEEWEDASEGDMTDIPEASLDGIDDAVPHAPTNTNGHIDVLSPVEMPVGTETHEWEINKDKCPGFAILETVPDDHPFKSDRGDATHGRDWLARIRKEHKILQTSLPGITPFVLFNM
jgi:hypothetical protein